MRHIATIGAAALALSAAAPAAAVTTVLTFSGNICSGGQACGDSSAIDQSYGDSAIQNVSYRSIVAATGATSEAFLKFWNTGYGDLQGVVWGGFEAANYISEITFTALAGYEVSLIGFDAGCYLNRASCQTFPYSTSVSGGGFTTASVSPPSGGHSSVLLNTAYGSSVVLRWGPDGYDGGLDNIAFDVRRVQVGGAVPEPATWAMMLMGFGGLGLALRRRPAGARIRFA